MQRNGTEAVDDRAAALAELFLRDATRFDAAARNLAGNHHVVDVPVNGSSMGASLPDGTIVRVQLGMACAVGDVVVFRQREQVVAHRVIHRTAVYLLTRGDARFAPDPPVPFDRVLGRVTGNVPHRAAPRSRIARAGNAAAVRLTVAALRLGPGVAAWLVRLLTLMERWPLRFRARTGARTDR